MTQYKTNVHPSLLTQYNHFPHYSNRHVLQLPLLLTSKNKKKMKNIPS